MNDNRTFRVQLSARPQSERRGMHCGSIVCLFIVVLAVFGWVMHRRLTQYDTPQQAIHQSTAIKACVTKRNPISVPSLHGTDGMGVFQWAFAYTAILQSPENSQAAVAYRVQRERSDQHADAVLRPCLDHFFLLPPPSLLSEL